MLAMPCELSSTGCMRWCLALQGSLQCLQAAQWVQMHHGCSITGPSDNVYCAERRDLLTGTPTQSAKLAVSRARTAPALHELCSVDGLSALGMWPI